MKGKTQVISTVSMMIGEFSKLDNTVLACNEPKEIQEWTTLYCKSELGCFANANRKISLIIPGDLQFLSLYLHGIVSLKTKEVQLNQGLDINHCKIIQSFMNNTLNLCNQNMPR